MVKSFTGGEQQKLRNRSCGAFAYFLLFRRDAPEFGLLADGGEATVDAVLLHQLIVRARLFNAVILHHEDLVGISNGCQAMGDRDDRLAARQLGDRLLNGVLVFGVDARRHLVEDDNGRIFQDRACDGDALLFAAGERAAAIADDGVIAVRQRHDEVVAARLFRRRDHLVLRRVGLAEEDVCADRVVEEVDVLEHHRDVREQTVAGKFAQVVSADGDAAALRIVKAREQTANGRLAAA